MKPSEFINESEYSHEEYDDEAGMVKDNLLTTIRMSLELAKSLDDNEDLPEWCQEKIAVAKGMIVAVGDYILSQHEQGVQPHIAEDGGMGGITGSGAIAATPGIGGGKPKSQVGSLFGGTYKQKKSKKK